MMFLRFLHKIYRKLISPCLGNCCRFHPSCGDYALEACEKHGMIYGAVLSFYRVLRCQPFSKGGFDPVPSRKSFSQNNSSSSKILNKI